MLEGNQYKHICIYILCMGLSLVVWLLWLVYLQLAFVTMQIWISSNWENFATDVITSEKKNLFYLADLIIFHWEVNKRVSLCHFDNMMVKLALLVITNDCVYKSQAAFITFTK